MDAAKAYELCGTSEKKVIRRRETENKYEDARIRTLYSRIRETIKSSSAPQGWEKVSFEEIMKAKDLDSRATDRGMIMQMLQADKNIISRPVTMGNSKDGTISHTIPLEYKYVDEDVKIEMAADAVCFRQVQGVNKKRIVNALKAMSEPYTSEWAEIFAVAEFLITRGAFEAWIYTRPLEIASMTSVPIDKVIEVLMTLYKAKILTIRNFDKPLEGEVARTKSICHLAKNEKDFEELSTVSLDDVGPIGIEKKPRASRKKQATLKKTKEFLQSLEREQAQEDKTDKRISSNSFEDKIVNALLQNGISGVQRVAALETAEYEKTITAKNDLLSKQSTEIADLRDEVAMLKQKLAKAQAMQSKLVEFNDGAIASAQDEMFVLQGQIPEIIKKYAQEALKDRTKLTDPIHVSKLAGQIISAVGRITDKMMEYKNDKFPPAEKR